MEVSVFHALVTKLREKQLLVDTRVVFIEEQVGIFLYELAKMQVMRHYCMIFNTMEKQLVDTLELCLMQLHSLHEYICFHLPYICIRS
jgi:hypothetical protein